MSLVLSFTNGTEDLYKWIWVYLSSGSNMQIQILGCNDAGIPFPS